MPHTLHSTTHLPIPYLTHTPQNNYKRISTSKTALHLTHTTRNNFTHNTTQQVSFQTPQGTQLHKIFIKLTHTIPANTTKYLLNFLFQKLKHPTLLQTISHTTHLTHTHTKLHAQQTSFTNSPPHLKHRHRNSNTPHSTQITPITHYTSHELLLTRTFLHTHHVSKTPHHT